MIAALTTAIANALAPMAAMGMLLAAFAALLAPRPGILLPAAIAQGALLAVAMLAQAWLQASPALLAAALLVAAIRAVALPLALRQIAPLHPSPAPPVLPTALAALALAGLAAWLGTPAGLGLALPLAVGLLGFLALARRRDPAGQLLGLATMEAGALLAAAFVPGMPLMPAVVLAGSLLSAAAAALLLRHALAPRRSP
jgi:hypothetical protein